MPYAIFAIYLPSNNRFVIGSVLTNRNKSIRELLVSPAGTAIKFCCDSAISSKLYALFIIHGWFGYLIACAHHFFIYSALPHNKPIILC